MCGICGEWSPGGAEEAGLLRMSRALAHRGPDGDGHVMLGEIGLAARRLAVVDPAGGRQPMANEDETIWVVFNGEVYNHAALRSELRRRGHRFRSASDTEVIVHLYEERGDELVHALRGMFAFALWDARRRRLLLARDRFGQKPLYYAEDGGRLLFASEIKALLPRLGRRPELDLDALDDYLALRFVPSPATLFRGVRKLPAAHLLVLDASARDPRAAAPSRPPLSARRYWSLPHRPKRHLDERRAAAEVRERLAAAVEGQLGADVPLGALLSGGMDSSAVVALMAAARAEPVPTFAIGVDEPAWSELPFAREVARHCGTEHREETVTAADVIGRLPEIVHHLDEPSDPVAPCMYHAARLASRHVKVVLTGDGGDELFGGFDRYLGFRWVSLYAGLPEPLRRRVLGRLLRALPDRGRYKNATQRLRWLHELSFHEGGRRYAEATAFFRFGGERREALYTADALARLGDRDPTACVARAFDEAEADDDLDRMLHADVATRLGEHSLLLADRLTMAHGLEARAPYLDHELAELVAQLPAGLKARGAETKRLLRRAARGLLPVSILRRPKRGFMFPLAEWLRGPLHGALARALSESALVGAGLFRSDALERLLGEHLRGRVDHHARLWMLLNVEIWYRLHVLGEGREDLGALLAEPARGPGARRVPRAGVR